MRNFEERKAEIFLRAEKKIKERKRVRRRLTGVGVSLGLCLCITAGVFLKPLQQPSDLGPIVNGKFETAISGTESNPPDCDNKLSNESQSETDISASVLFGNAGAEKPDGGFEGEISMEVSEEDTEEEASGENVPQWFEAACVNFAVLQVETVIRESEQTGEFVRTACLLRYTMDEILAKDSCILREGDRVNVCFDASETEPIRSGDTVVVILSSRSLEGEPYFFANREAVVLGRGHEQTLPAEIRLLNEYVEKAAFFEGDDACAEAFPDVPFSADMTAEEAIRFFKQVREALELL